jgi:hypothetical protein
LSNIRTIITDDVKKQMVGSKGEILLGDYFRNKGCTSVKISGNPFSEVDISLTYKDKVYKCEIKTQTPYVKLHRVSYPIRPAQLKKLKQIDFVYFLCKADDSIIGSSRFEGRLYRAKAIDVHNWIEKDHLIMYKKNVLLKYDRYTNSFWFNIPMSIPFLKLVHTFDKEDMEHFRKIGTSQYMTNQFNELVKKYNR